jgi:tetratricopeptide (TPR) repeat protein
MGNAGCRNKLDADKKGHEKDKDRFVNNAAEGILDNVNHLHDAAEGPKDTNKEGHEKDRDRFMNTAAEGYMDTANRTTVEAEGAKDTNKENREKGRDRGMTIATEGSMDTANRPKLEGIKGTDKEGHEKGRDRVRNSAAVGTMDTAKFGNVVTEDSMDTIKNGHGKDKDRLMNNAAENSVDTTNHMNTDTQVGNMDTDKEGNAMDRDRHRNSAAEGVKDSAELASSAAEGSMDTNKEGHEKDRDQVKWSRDRRMNTAAEGTMDSENPVNDAAKGPADADKEGHEKERDRHRSTPSGPRSSPRTASASPTAHADTGDSASGGSARAAELLTEAIAYKKEGNTEFQRQELQKALGKYRLAYDCIGTIGRLGSSCADADVINATHQELTALLGNMALVRLKAGEGSDEQQHSESAKRHYETVIELTAQILQDDSRNIKALYRRAVAAEKLGKEAVAREAITTARRIAPQNRDVINLEARLRARLRSAA